MAEAGGAMDVRSDRHTATIAHGTIMGLAFVIFLPLGAILIRVASFRGLVWVHAVIQSFAYALALVGLGLGLYITVYPDYQVRDEISNVGFKTGRTDGIVPAQYTADNGHPIIGTVVVAALYLQPALGLLHHLVYRKNGKTTVWAVLHVWWGRIIVTLGIINGGLGLMLSGNTTNGEIIYGAIAGSIWVVWMGTSAYSFVVSRGVRGGETGEKFNRKEVHEDQSAASSGMTSGSA